MDIEGKWSVRLANDLAKDAMTVDVTPRRCQKFRPKPGEKLRWVTDAGDSGDVAADAGGLVTMPRVKLRAGEQTVLTITR